MSDFFDSMPPLFSAFEALMKTADVLIDSVEFDNEDEGSESREIDGDYGQQSFDPDAMRSFIEAFQAASKAIANVNGLDKRIRECRDQEYEKFFTREVSP